MDAFSRERMEEILLKFSEVFPGEVPEDAFDSALHESLDSLEALFRVGPVSPEWLIDEYEVIRDADPSLSNEETMRRLAAYINERLQDEERF